MRLHFSTIDNPIVFPTMADAIAAFNSTYMCVHEEKAKGFGTGRGSMGNPHVIHLFCTHSLPR